MLCYVTIKVWRVTPCGAVKSALRFPPSFWHYLCLAFLLLCLNRVRTSSYGAREVGKALPIFLSYTTGSGAISEACVILCA